MHFLAATFLYSLFNCRTPTGIKTNKNLKKKKAQRIGGPEEATGTHSNTCRGPPQFSPFALRGTTWLLMLGSSYWTLQIFFVFLPFSFHSFLPFFSFPFPAPLLHPFYFVLAFFLNSPHRVPPGGILFTDKYSFLLWYRSFFLIICDSLFFLHLCFFSPLLIIYLLNYNTRSSVLPKLPSSIIEKLTIENTKGKK